MHCFCVVLIVPALLTKHCLKANALSNCNSTSAPEIHEHHYAVTVLDYNPAMDSISCLHASLSDAKGYQFTVIFSPAKSARTVFFKISLGLLYKQDQEVGKMEI